MCFRATLLPSILPFPKNIEMHDRWIGLMAELEGNVSFYKECLINYRVHGSNVSNSTNKSVNNVWTMIKIRYWMCLYSLIRWISIKLNS